MVRWNELMMTNAAQDAEVIVEDENGDAYGVSEVLTEEGRVILFLGDPIEED